MRILPLRSAVALALGSLVLTACGSATHTPGAAGSPTGKVELIGQAAVMKRSPEADVELCFGAMAQSYPPQCGGPKVLGTFSWDDVESEEHAGVRWTNEWYVAVGHFDKAANTFTLTRPLSKEPPDGFTFPDVDDTTSFPQLCDDPFRGGDPDSEDPDFSIQSAFQEHLETMPGYVESWVSDGERMFNVIVTGDAEEAHAELREIWPGGLCVEQRDAPAMSDVEAATDALSKHSEELGLLSYGGQGVLGVQPLVADEATVKRIHEIVAPWLTPDQVAITGTLVPLTETP